MLRYPDNLEKPVIITSGANASPVVRLILKTLPENPRHINSYRTYLENEIRQYLERIDGVSELQIFGDTEAEMQVILNPERMAAFGVTIKDMIEAMDRHNVNVSAGDLNLGSRNYRIRTVGEYKSPEDVEQTVIQAFGDRFVKVGDVARVEPGFEKRSVAMVFNGEDGIHVCIVPQVDVNVLDLMDRTEEVSRRLNSEKPEPQGLRFEVACEQRPCIRGAINLVKQNILIGGVLAVVVALSPQCCFHIFVGMAIPISIIGTFIFLEALGRNLNVISLAGISFSVGMLVDNAIALTCAILLSLAVSITVIPMLAQQLFSLQLGGRSKDHEPKTSFLVRMGGAIVRGIMALVRLCMRKTC